MKFLYPHAFWLLILIPIFIYLYIKKIKTGNEDGIYISTFKELSKIANLSWKAKFRHILFIFRIIAIILCIVILARPQIPGEIKEDETKEGIDIVLILDVSISMLAEDFTPNRLEAAKKVTESFIGNRENDRLATVVFAGRAFTQVPLTFDYNIIKESIKNISTQSIKQSIKGLSGTAIGLALSSALLKFDETADDRTKIMILLTDGESNQGPDPVVIADLIRERGVKIYTIGIGKKNTPIPYIDALGRKQFLRQPDGRPVTTKLDEKTLKKIAEITDGKYYHADNVQKLEKIYKEIDALEKTKITIERKMLYDENYEPFAWLVLLFLFLEYILGQTWLRVYQ